MTQKKMKLGVSMRGYGYHGSAWRHPDVPAGALLTWQHFHGMVTTAERGFFDIAFLADYVGFDRADNPPGALGRRNHMLDLEPITLQSALAPMTRHIGLIATASPSYHPPYNIARLFASLDMMSGGRAGWNVVASGQPMEARNFNAEGLLDKAARYRRAREAVQVVMKLWESWEPDAFIRDKESGLYFDPAKMHPTDHKGEFFQVAGPLTVPPSPQGRPVIFQAGASEDGQELAAETADVVYAAYNDLGEAQDFYNSLKGRLHRFGRGRDDLKILPGIVAVIGATEADAQARHKQMMETVDPHIGMAYLTLMFGDMSGVDLDAPLPAHYDDREYESTRVFGFINLARRENLTVRQLYQRGLIGNGHNVAIGTPAMVADEMERWFKEGGADGFNVLPPYNPMDLTLFVDTVVPELQRRGLLRTEYEGTTLRENLELPWPRPVMASRAA